MSKERLTKREALELITPIVDEEVSEDKRIAFFAYIETNEDVRRKYESAKRIKELIRDRCPCAKAPKKLRERVHHFLKKEGRANDKSPEEAPIYDMPSPFSPAFPSRQADGSEGSGYLTYRQSQWINWIYAVAATLMVLMSFWGIVYRNLDSHSYNIEEYTYRHFINHEGKLITPTIATASLSNAEVQLANDYDFNTKIPTLQDAEFKGVAYTEFVPNFMTPMLEYYFPDDGQYVYIFAFNIDKIQEFQQLARDKDAVQVCINPKDFHIRTFNDKHVVSWKWNNTWYTAISNRDGESLISLIEPLHYEIDSTEAEKR